MKTMIIVPVFNEGMRCVDTINQILLVSKCDVIVVDDGSRDDSLQILNNKFKKNKRVYVLSHIINLGKGAAMKTGIKMAWKLGSDAVIFIDADGQHNPKYLPKFEAGLEQRDMVFGYRRLNGNMPFVRKYGNMAAKAIVRFLFGVKRKEFLCGYLGFKKSVYKKIKWQSSRYGVETEIATKVGRNQLTFLEVEIDTIYIDKYKGVSLFDAMKILIQIPFWYFSK
ncbi:MAG: glycosyltransferase family 2 protein [Candidatus Shapirobacteria bacterium]